ncbi:MAG: hypothetical protein QXG65_05650, partial [Thermoplasmata archaeon]
YIYGEPPTSFLSMAAPPPARPRAPASVRASRWLGRAATIVVVVAIVWTAVVAYSGVRFAQGLQGSSGSSDVTYTTELAGTGVYLNVSYPVRNGGVLPVTGLTVAAMATASSGDFIAGATSPSLTVPAGGSASVPIDLHIAFGGTGNASSGLAALTPLNLSLWTSLLTDNQTLGLHVWANLTYGYLYPIQLQIQRNYSWAAPFPGLTYAIGTPVVSGSVETVNATFQMYYAYSVAYQVSVSFALYSAAGALCGTGTMPVTLTPNHGVHAVATATLATGCSLSHGTVRSSVQGLGFAFPLPEVELP